MHVVITREAAKAAVLAEIDRTEGEPPPWLEMHLYCAIEAIRRGDAEIACNHVVTLRRGPTLEETTRLPRRPLLTKARLRKMLEAL
ncbi:MAG: hypothetical protein WCK95_27455 [Alphaproteobacteria bacterium]|jgi:hypothetical protein